MEIIKSFYQENTTCIYKYKYMKPIQSALNKNQQILMI